MTLDDIEKFAALSWRHVLCAHGRRPARLAIRCSAVAWRTATSWSPAAAGLFVDPAYGPVLANYGIDSLRFVKPVKPGDRIKVRLTCKEKSLRPDKGYGEVRWDTEITNQADEVVAQYDVLTMVSSPAARRLRASFPNLDDATVGVNPNPIPVSMSIQQDRDRNQ